MTARIEKIKSKLANKLTVESIQVDDDSHKHVGHAGARDGGSHFQLTIVAKEFEGLNTVARHRLIYEALGDLMQHDIHALGIQAYSPLEI